MTCYVGLDVSMKETAICVVDEMGNRVWDGKTRTDPDAIAAVLARRAAGAVKIGIETGPMTVWLWHALTERELPVVCLHARHAAAALKLQMNKTDRNDAFGLARLVRSGWYRHLGKRLDRLDDIERPAIWRHVEGARCPPRRRQRAHLRSSEITLAGHLQD